MENVPKVVVWFEIGSYQLRSILPCMFFMVTIVIDSNPLDLIQSGPYLTIDLASKSGSKQNF